MVKTFAVGLVAGSMLAGTAAFAGMGGAGGGGGMGVTGTNFGQSQTELWHWSDPQPVYPKAVKHYHKPVQKQQ
jgi:hypothetical protein